MEEVLTAILEAEDFFSREAADEEAEPRLALQAELMPFTGMSQEQLSQILQRFYDDGEGSVATAERLTRMLHGVLNLEPADMAIQVQNLCAVFFGGAGQSDAFEILFFLITYSRLDSTLKVEDLFDIFDYNQNRRLQEEEYVISFRSFCAGLQKCYASALSIKPKDDEEFYHSLTVQPDFFPMTHDSFVQFMTRNKQFTDFMQMTLKYSNTSTDADVEAECPSRGKPEISEGFLTGDEFMAIKPWKGAIHAPTKAPKVVNTPPDASLRLEWINGYRAQDCRNNLFFAAKNTVVYHSAGVGIVLDPRARTQVFNLAHDDDVTCLALHPNKQVVATGQLGAKPKVVVWDAATGTTLAELSNFHKRAVTSVSFSPSGKYILTVGLDDKHSVAVYEWEGKSPRLIGQSTGSQEKTLDSYFLTDDVFVTCGVKHLFYWSLVKGQLTKKKGLFNKLPLTTVLSVSRAPGSSGNFVTGVLSGDLYEWVGSSASRKYKAHTGGCYALYCNGVDLVSGGKDGRILIWGDGMVMKREIDFSKQTTVLQLSPTKEKVPLETVQIRSLCLSEDAKRLLVGTKFSEIFDIPIDSYTPTQRYVPLITGNFADELWGLAVDMNDPDQYATTGDDHTLRLWSLKRRQQIGLAVLPTMSRAVAYSPDGAIACGLGGRVGKAVKDKFEGMVVCLKKTVSSSSMGGHWELHITKTRHDSKQWISDLKFSPSGSLLAAGGHDDFIYLYQWPGLQYKARCRGHSSYITHFDFSADSRYLQSNCGAYELLFWDVSNGSQITASSSLRNTQWATQTCVLGWPVQGIWPPCSDGTDVNGLDTTPTRDVIVTSDDFGKVNLFRYPCVETHSACSSYIGHSSHVTCVRFAGTKSQTTHVVSTGGNDRSTFQWRFESDQEEILPESQSISQDLDLFGGVADSMMGGGQRTSQVKEIRIPEGGDEFLAVKPWLGAIHAPSNPPKANPSAPVASLDLQWVFGYQAQESRNNLRYNASGGYVYFGAAVGVVYDPKTHTQRYNLSHGDDIVSLALHPSQKVVATGELGANPKIVVWDTETGACLAELSGLHKRAVILLSFSADGVLLGSVGNDDRHTVGIYDWAKGKLVCSSDGERNKVLDLCWDDSGVMIQCGDKHVKFWERQGPNLSCRKGVLSSFKGTKALSPKLQIFPTVIFDRESHTSIVGTVEGHLYVFTGKNLTSIVPAHKGAVMSLYSGSLGVLSGGKDGVICVFDHSMSPVTRVEVTSAVARATPSLPLLVPEIRSVCSSADGKRLLVGTKGSDILEMTYDASGESRLLNDYMRGHCADELWGLAIHPTEPLVITAGDDKTVRVYNVETRREVGCLALDCMARALAIHPAGDALVVGLGGRVGRGKQRGDGGLLVVTLSRDGSKLEVRGKLSPSTEWISEIKFSPNKDKFAVGSHDDRIYIYNWARYTPVLHRTLKGHSSYITHFDFSMDGKYLQSNCGAYELLFWDVNSGGQITASSSLRNTQWATQTCVLGWPVQGIWPPCSDGTDVNGLDFDAESQLIATSDDFGLVKLFNYPCLKKGAAFVQGRGHSSHVTCVRWGSRCAQGKFLVTTGGNDRCTFLWSCTKEGDRGADRLRMRTATANAEGALDEPVDESDAAFEAQESSFSKQSFDAPSGGDEFMAVRPWEGAIFAPSKPPPVNPSLPSEKLVLDTVFGYRAQNSRNNLKYNIMGNLVYHVAAVGVIQPHDGKQIFHIGHSDDIVCLAMDPSLQVVATGEMGPHPLINVWDSTTGELLVSLQKTLQKAVLALSFSPDGTKLVGVGQDNNHSISIYGRSGPSWKKATLLGTSKGDVNNTLFAEWFDNTTFMTGGVKHGLFWNSGTSTSKRALFVKFPIDTLVCATRVGGNMVCGTAKGNIYVYTGNQATGCRDAHFKNGDGAVGVLCRYSGGVISGSKKGSLIVWSEDLAPLATYDLRKYSIPDDPLPLCEDFYPMSLTLSQDENRLLLGTASSDIIEFDVDRSRRFEPSAPRRLATGHYRDELWGCCPHPSDPDVYVSCGDDNTVRVWSMSERRMTRLIRVPRMARAVDFSPDGSLLAVGLGGRMGGVRATKENNENKGGFIIYSFPSMEVVADFKDMCEKHVSDVKFSEDGSFFAVGTHDTKVYMFRTTNFLQSICSLSKGHSYVTHFDFSRNSKYIQVTYGDYELLFYSTEKGNQITTPSSLKDMEWCSQTCVLGWPVQGIWAGCDDGTDINYTDRSHRGNLLIAGDDFGKVRMYRYPVITKNHKFTVGIGHSSHVPMVKFNSDDSMVISTGGNDRAVMLWRLE